MQLYEINQNGNRYCGPSVVSAIAGIGTKEAAAIFRARNGRAFIKGSSHYDVTAALRLLGFNSSTLGTYTKQTRVTLRQWAKTHARGDDVYLIDAGHHWLLVQGRYAICGRTINLVAVADHPNARAFVKTAYRITPARKVDPATVIPKKPQHLVTEATAKRKARALAKQHGIELEPITDERDASIGVFQAPGHHDRHSDGHYFSPNDWSSILERVQEYVACQNRTPEIVNESTAKHTAQELACKHKISISQDTQTYVIWVDAPESISEDDDPYADEHFCDTWVEALARVKAYVAMLPQPTSAPTAVQHFESLVAK